MLNAAEGEQRKGPLRKVATAAKPDAYSSKCDMNDIWRCIMTDMPPFSRIMRVVAVVPRRHSPTLLHAKGGSSACTPSNLRTGILQRAL